MVYLIDIQHATEAPFPVSDDEISQWVTATLTSHIDKAELTIRLVSVADIQHLNHTYRNKNSPTNVLAFPAHIPSNITLDYPLLGDVIICPAILQEESISQNTALTAHWAHIIIHGVLHLLGYDHINDDDACRMQTREIKLLTKLGFSNPYTTEDYEIE